MKTITKDEFLEDSDFYSSEVKEGKIFVYPTDTIYGIGCDALNGESIEKIREIKKRDSKPLSVIVPNVEWIKENCFVDEKGENALAKLPGPYTFIADLRNTNCIAKEELIGDLTGLGVRIPNNWFSEWISKNNLVFVTSSVNASGEANLVNPDELKEEIKEKIDYLISDGLLIGKASTIIDLRNGKILRD
jgi:L-threonylcarbamoyladenylate synthase